MPAKRPPRPISEGDRRYPSEHCSGSVLVDLRADRRISVCIPARDEAATVGTIVNTIVTGLTEVGGGLPLLHEVVVVDDGSVDNTADLARAAGARVVSAPGKPQDGSTPTVGGHDVGGFGGKGQAMRAALKAAQGDVIVFVDADIANFDLRFVTGLLGPMLTDDRTALVKGFYERPLNGSPSGGGRVTELMARPLIDLLFPQLSAIIQPLAGEMAAPRWVLERCGLADGYAVELSLLIDVVSRFGAESVAQADLGVRVHRNRPLHELRPQATAILRAALDRAGLAATRG